MVNVELTDVDWLEVTVFAVVLTVYRIGIPEAPVDNLTFVAVGDGKLGIPEFNFSRSTD